MYPFANDPDAKTPLTKGKREMTTAFCFAISKYFSASLFPLSPAGRYKNHRSEKAQRRLLKRLMYLIHPIP